MNRTALFRIPALVVASLLVTAVFFSFLLAPAQTARGKSAARPLAQTATPVQQGAQEAALADSRVAAATSGRRTEVFGVREMLGQLTAESQACATAVCFQVEIYNFDDNAALLAIVNTDTGEVLDVLHQPGVQPGINKRLADRAIEIATHDPQVIAALGYRPQHVEVAPVPAGMPGTVCDEGHLCAAPTFSLGDRLLWAIVDLTTEQLVDIAWTEIVPEIPNNSVPFIPQGCPAPGTVNRAGWQLSYQTTGTDGLRVHTVSYDGVPVINNVKLVEWHAAYTSSGFVDSTGCGGGGGGFPIYPYGDTEVLDLHDELNNVIGFEVVQDFRMSNWGGNCNYRYDQRVQFFNDGRFRVVSGAYGKGCGTNATYRPVVRMDIAVNGSEDNSFATWNGETWIANDVEFWQLQDGPYTPEGYKWAVSHAAGLGYFMEPGQGQFGDNGRGDFAYLYVTQHKPSEGDTDLGVIGSCCNSDHQQGPHNYVNGESIADQNIVIWYVPQMVTEVTPGSYYCWTISGEPNPETYPCYAGPMFVPFTPHAAGVVIAPPTATQSGMPGTVLTYTLAVTNTGSVSDSIAFAVSGNTWDVGLPLTLTLEAGESSTVPVTVAIPADAAGGAVDVATVTGTSLNDPGVTASAVLTSTATAVYGVLLTPATAVLPGAPGNTVTHTLTLTNSGNLSDTFAITLSESLWEVAAPTSVSLGAAETTTFHIGVTIPETAVEGQSEVLTVTLTSAGDEMVTAVSTLTTIAISEAHWLYLPTILRP